MARQGSGYGVGARYPAFDEPTGAEADAAIEFARDIVAAVRQAVKE